MQIIKYRVLVIITFIWCVPLPFFWAYNLSKDVNVNYLSWLGLYIPQLITAALAVVILTAAWIKKRWAINALFTLSLFVPILWILINSPTHGTWGVTSFLLGLTGWSLRRQYAASQKA